MSGRVPTSVLPDAAPRLLRSATVWPEPLHDSTPDMWPLPDLHTFHAGLAGQVAPTSVDTVEPRVHPCATQLGAETVDESYAR